MKKNGRLGGAKIRITPCFSESWRSAIRCAVEFLNGRTAGHNTRLRSLFPEAEKIIKLVFSRPREIRVLSQQDQFAYHRLSTRKARKESLVSVQLASAVLVKHQKWVGGGHRNDFFGFFPSAFVNSQIAQVNRPKILERMVSGSSPLRSKVFVTAFVFFFNWGLKKF